MGWGMAGKVSREYNLMYPWISMDCPRTPWGEMAGKVTPEYIVSIGLDTTCIPE